MSIIVREMLANARATVVSNVPDAAINPLDVTIRPRATRVLPPGDSAVTGQRSRISVGAGCIAFLWIYAGLHLAHAFGVEPPFVRSVAPIPLFAICLISLATAAAASVPAAYLLIGNRRWLASLPAALATSIVAFALSVILVP
jgi:hypothetical protein